MEPKRLVEIDILRAIAIIGVIAIHATIMFMPVYTSYSASDPADAYINQLARISVPMFLFVSGLSLTLSQVNRPLTIGAFLKKRFLKVLIPYAIFTIIYTWIHTQQVSVTLLQNVLSNILTGKGEYHLYFILLILECYISFPVIFFILAHLRVKARIYVVLSLFILQILLLQIFMMQRFHGTGPNEDFAFRTLPFWLFYFVFGIVAAFYAQTFERFCKKIPAWLSLPAILVGAMLLTIETAQYARMNASYDALNFFRPSIVVYSLFAIVAWLSLAYRLLASQHHIAQIKHALAAIGRHSFGIYLVHIVILESLVRRHIIDDPGPLSTIELTLATLGLSFFAVIGYHKLTAGITQRTRLHIAR